jgi:transcriptional regulator of acetoin/glycerol metabolism
VTVRELPNELRSRPPEGPTDGGLDLDRNERALILKALERFSWNRRRAAQALNISTVTLWRRMKRYGIARP